MQQVMLLQWIKVKPPLAPNFMQGLHSQATLHNA